jgi:hypothetical protein
LDFLIETVYCSDWRKNLVDERRWSVLKADNRIGRLTKMENNSNPCMKGKFEGGI